MIAALSLLGSALGAAAPAAASQAVDKAGAVSSAGVDFSQVLADASADAVNALKTGEATSIAGLQGKASVQQVVESVMSAQQSLNTAVAIRDKIVAAYQALSQMAI
ncbi:flagellar hook-basal body complex protein FliE [Methylocapsa polymorpha]|uniref:Flagellar hook-basal body complex protein FliE n=1 Tax=Methylocapsa polymorpha TaxID=3080828 RepID=A0ABZ0HPR7_9HYPH|nr:flagellar hook-basal body complex protein FliE [Methylocapsa sp. RX1]